MLAQARIALVLSLCGCATGLDDNVSDAAPTGRVDARPGFADGAPPADARPDGGASLGTVLLLGQDLDATEWNVYRSALSGAGIAFSELAIDGTSFPSAEDLASADTVLWVSDLVIGPDDAECQRVVDWLGAGSRSLLLAGRDMMWDLNINTDKPGELALYNATGVAYLGDRAAASPYTGITTVVGIASDPIGGDFVSTPLALTGDTMSSGDYFDAGASMATVGMVYGAGGANDNGAGHGVLSHYQNGDDRIVVVGLNIHNGLTEASQKTALLLNIFETLAH